MEAVYYAARANLRHLLQQHPCNGYLGHPFEKEDTWAFTARLFFFVRWHSAIVIAGEWVSWTRENSPGWAADHQKTMHKLHERPVKDPFSHELSAGWTSSTSWMLAPLLLLQAAQW